MVSRLAGKGGLMSKIAGKVGLVSRVKETLDLVSDGEEKVSGLLGRWVGKATEGC